MIDVDLPAGPAEGALARGFAACLASVTEVRGAGLPQPDDDLAHALGAWRSWLAGRGSGLVPIADPVGFQWAGWWIAVVAEPRVRPTARRWPCWRSGRRRVSRCLYGKTSPGAARRAPS